MRRSPALHPAILRLLAPALGALLFSSAQAQPPIDPGTVQLRWDACYEDGGSSLRAFACNTNSGFEALIVTATPEVDLPQFNGVSADIAIHVLATTLPPWWQIGSSFCRAGASVGSQFTPPVGASGCSDPYLGQAAGGTNYQLNHEGHANQALLRLVAAIPGSTPVLAGQNIFVARVLLTHGRSTGAGSCAGCSTPTGIGLKRVGLYQPLGVGDDMILYPDDGTDSDFVSWQSPVEVTAREYYHSPSTGWHKYFTVSTPTAATRPTWGAIKGLYLR